MADARQNASGAPVVQEVSGSATSAAVLSNFPVDAQDYTWVSLFVSNSATSQIAWEASNDNSTWFLFALTSVGGGVSAATSYAGVASSAMFCGPLPGRYFRARVTSYTSGTASVVAEFSSAQGYGGEQVLGLTNGGASTTMPTALKVINNNSVDQGSGASSLGTQRVILATDQPVVPISDNAGSLTVDGTVTASNAAGDVASGSSDSGNPVKIGAKGLSALPTAVTTGQRVNAMADLWGRLMVTHIDPAMQVTKAVNVTTTQTGTDVWSPTSGKKIAVTYLSVASYGTVGARVILWFGDNADTTYTAGTDQVLWAGSFAPSATAKPGMVIAFSTPVFCTTADREIHLTTDAGISLDITVVGYEW